MDRQGRGKRFGAQSEKATQWEAKKKEENRRRTERRVCFPEAKVHRSRSTI